MRMDREGSGQWTVPLLRKEAVAAVAARGLADDRIRFSESWMDYLAHQLIRCIAIVFAAWPWAGWRRRPGSSLPRARVRLMRTGRWRKPTITEEP
jgi:hypothetical protein